MQNTTESNTENTATTSINNTDSSISLGDNSPIPEDMLRAIIKTFTVQHSEDSDLHLAQALVYNAARLAWRMRESGLSTEEKTSVTDVVTAADRAAEIFITEALRTLRPEDGLLGEEGTRRDSASGRTWVIDPVDGTYNFTIGSDYWCSALALVEGDPAEPARVIYGAVHRPAMGYTWCGGSEQPTVRDGKPWQLRDVSLSQTALGGYCHPSSFAQPALRDAWLAVVTKAATVRMLGSASIDLADVAGGQVGVWLQHSVCDWDWLPGRALIEAAGGRCEIVEAVGKRWYVGGAPSAVAEVVEILRSCE